MVKKQARQSTEEAETMTMDQVSAGGVAFRWHGSEPEMVTVSVKPSLRWQLPKGIVDPGWVSFAEAIEMLAFESERGVAEKARAMITERGRRE